MEPFDLTPEQQNAFNKLEKAYNECEKNGIYFVNNYGSLEAYNKRYIVGYVDDCPDSRRRYKMTVSADRGTSGTSNSIKLPNEWCDDNHLFIMTEEGFKLCKEN